MDFSFRSAMWWIVCLYGMFLQVGILLYVADLIVRLMWRRSLDPDNFSIPYLTAMGDLLGTGFLALVFRSVSLMEGLGLWKGGRSSVCYRPLCAVPSQTRGLYHLPASPLPSPLEGVTLLGVGMAVWLTDCTHTHSLGLQFIRRCGSFKTSERMGWWDKLQTHPGPISHTPHVTCECENGKINTLNWTFSEIRERLLINNGCIVCWCMKMNFNLFTVFLDAGCIVGLGNIPLIIDRTFFKLTWQVITGTICWRPK